MISRNLGLICVGCASVWICLGIIPCLKILTLLQEQPNPQAPCKGFNCAEICILSFAALVLGPLTWVLLEWGREKEKRLRLNAVAARGHVEIEREEVVLPPAEAPTVDRDDSGDSHDSGDNDNSLDNDNSGVSEDDLPAEPPPVYQRFAPPGSEVVGLPPYHA
ncbi:hypothetical protein AB5N19_10632 [Seiridium cardinale]|uniref:Uncharacterized protein n=1 Tax=Seiridium cardinale TaxID=138064 RepID=A0ABR2XSV1_9PEZI